MPSINTLYFAAHKSSDAPTLTIFKERGLDNKIPSTVDALEIYAKPSIRSAAMALYKDNFTMALKAYQNQEGVIGFGGAAHVRLTAKLDQLFFAFPKIIATHDHQDRAAAEKFFEDSGFVKIQNKSYATFIGPATPEFVTRASLYSVSMETRTDRGVTNILGFAAFSHVSKLIKVFLAIHNAVVEDGSPVGIVTNQPSAMDTDDTAWGDRLQTKFIGAINGDDFPLDTEDVEYSGFRQSVALGAKNSYTGAMRPVVDSGVARYWGPASACPFKKGIVIPYFPDLLIPGGKAAVSIVQQYFYGTFGTTEEACIAGMTKFRKGFAFLSGTESGIAMTHAMKCVGLAMEAHSGLYLVLEKGVYHGCVLGGEGFLVANKGVIVRPVGDTAFSDSLLDISGHDHSLVKLCKLLSRCPLKADQNKKEKVVAKDVKSSLELLEQIDRRGWKIPGDGDDDEEEDVGTEIYELCDKVNFDQSYLVPTIENILKAAEIIMSDGKVTWPKGTPVYLRGAVYEDIYSRTLASFGHIAPSLMAAKGDMMNFAKSDKKDEDPALKDHPKVKGIQAMRYMAVHTKNLAQAAKDWKEMVQSGGVRYQTGVRGGPVKCSFSYIAEKRDVFWYGISKIVGEGTKDKAKMGKKRKAEGDDEETRAKKQKAAQEFLDNLF